MERDNNLIPDVDERIELWSAIWRQLQSAQYNEEAEWLKDEVDLTYAERKNDIKITTEMMKKQLRRNPNLKAPAPDGQQVF